MATQYPEWARRERAHKDLRKEVEAKLDRVYLEALDNLYQRARELTDNSIAGFEFAGDAYGKDKYDSFILWFDRSDMPPMYYKRVKTPEL